MARILALDVGKRRIGLAVSDALGITAQGIPTFQRTTIREDMARMGDIVDERQISLLVIGHPLHMSGRESRQATHVKEFGDRLSKFTGLPVEYHDERLTTKEAMRVLKESGIGIEKRAKAIDKLSAVLILQSWLERCGSCES